MQLSWGPFSVKDGLLGWGCPKLAPKVCEAPTSL